MSEAESIRTKPEGPLWTTADVARFLGCSERQVYVLRNQGLPSIHVDSLVRFDPVRVRAWLNRGAHTAAPSDERAHQLADIAATGDDDNAQCAAADLAREFPAHH